MRVTDLWTYLVVTAVVVITPGADTMIVVRQAVRGGTSYAAGTAAGVCSGLLVWAAASAVGLAAALAASHHLFTAIKLAGAAYLVYLGVSSLWTARRPTVPSGQAARGGWRSGALTCLGNPKVGVFYLSFLPQFVPPGASALHASLLLAAIHIALSFACLLGYGLLAARIGNLLSRDVVRRRVEAFSGAVLCALGLGLITETARGTG